MEDELRVIEIILKDKEYQIKEDIKVGEKMVKKKTDLGNKIKEILEPYRGVDWLVKAMELYKFLINMKQLSVLVVLNGYLLQ